MVLRSGTADGLYGRFIGDKFEDGARNCSGDAIQKFQGEPDAFRQKAALVGFRVNLKKILAHGDLAACVKQPEAACADQFISQAAMLFQGEFLRADRMIAHWQIVVAMEAFEGTAAGDLDRHLERRTFPLETLMNHARQFTVCYRLHV
jgi:hypothetical protein